MPVCQSKVPGKIPTNGNEIITGSCHMIADNANGPVPIPGTGDGPLRERVDRSPTVMNGVRLICNHSRGA
jgi:hypothetical protein